MRPADGTDATLRQLLTDASTIAVVGASSNPDRPSHGIMQKLLSAGYQVIPVNPRETEVLGQKAFASLADVPAKIDIVDVFRRAEETPAIAEQAVRVGARALWLQLGIVNDEAAERARSGGLAMVMDECIGVAHARLLVPLKRAIARVETTPPPEPGFIGQGHTAVEVLAPVAPAALAERDPFVLLMDDRLSLGAGRRIGEAHPHAGLETVTLILEGDIRDHDEGELGAGDAIWMTAGRGIIHNEDVFVKGNARILQLWIRLSKAERGAEPRFEIIRFAALPIHRARGVEARLYSGQTAGLSSPTKNHVPVTLVDVRLDAGARFAQDLPRSYNGFAYVLEGQARLGSVLVGSGQVGWLARRDDRGASTLSMRAENGPTRVVLYAGEPQNEPIVQHGPFVADSKEGIIQMHQRFQSGQFVRMSELAHRA